MRQAEFIFVSHLHILNMFYKIPTQTEIKSFMESEIEDNNYFPILDPTSLTACL